VVLQEIVKTPKDAFVIFPTPDYFRLVKEGSGPGPTRRSPQALGLGIVGLGVDSGGGHGQQLGEQPRPHQHRRRSPGARGRFSAARPRRRPRRRPPGRPRQATGWAPARCRGRCGSGSRVQAVGAAVGGPAGRARAAIRPSERSPLQRLHPGHEGAAVGALGPQVDPGCGAASVAQPGRGGGVTAGDR
jgi:hypothetical protein